MSNDTIWKQRAEDLKDVRTAIESLLDIIRQAKDMPPPTHELVINCHKLIALHMQTLERYTRPIPIVSPFGIPLDVFKDAMERYQDLGLPFYLVTELLKED
jgi:hypothetical protein